MPDLQDPKAPPTKDANEPPDLGPVQPTPPVSTVPPTPAPSPTSEPPVVPPQQSPPAVPASPVSIPSPANSEENNSGMGSGSSVPPGIEGWGWGPFFFTGLWGIFNNVWVALLAWIPIFPVGLIMAIVLGINGRKWAWQKKKWRSVEHFNEVQRKWSRAGVIIGVLFLLAWVAIFLVVFVVALTQPGGIEYNSGY